MAAKVWHKRIFYILKRSFLEQESKNSLTSFKNYENAEWRNAISQSWRKLRRKDDVRKENEKMINFCGWEKALFHVLDVFFQNRQGSLVSKNSKKQRLVMHSNKKQKIWLKCWESRNNALFVGKYSWTEKPFVQHFELSSHI